MERGGEKMALEDVLNWASPIGLGIFFTGLGILFWGLQFLRKKSREKE